MEALAGHRAARAADAPPVSVRDARPDDAARWDAYVLATPAATFFHRFAWRGLIEDVFRHRTHYLVAERGTTIVGLLPLAEVRSLLFGHSLASLPFAAYGGPAADDALAEHALVDAAVERAKRLGVTYLELRNVTPRCPEWPRQELYVTFRKTMASDPEENMLAIPRKQRAMVRKGINNGLAGEIDASVERFFRLYADNVHRHGTPPLPRAYFERLRATFGEDCEVLTVIDNRGEPVSSVLSFYFRDEVLPYYAGDATAARGLAANDFKYWELMRRAIARGVRVFDYGRSKRGSGSYDFKKNWGFQPAPLAYEFRLLRRQSIPQNNPANPKYRALIALWRRLPIGVANALGPHIVRALG